jgi:hypothetical protein
MSSKRIDQTYAKLTPEIREIVETVRAIIHKAEPAIEETWKWGPAYEKNGLALGLWGFKKHVSLVFYRGSEMSDKHKLFNAGMDNAKIRMIKFTSLGDVNEKKLIAYIKEAVKVNASGKSNISKVVKKAERKLEIPAELAKWFVKNKKAKTFFDSISFSHKRELVNYLDEAKQEATRKRRLEKITAALKEERKTF